MGKTVRTIRNRGIFSAFERRAAMIYMGIARHIAKVIHEKPAMGDGIKQRIRKAETISEVFALWKTGKTYAGATDDTQRKYAKEAKKRIDYLQTV